MNVKLLPALAGAALAVLAGSAAAQQPAPYDQGRGLYPPIDTPANRPARDYEACRALAEEIRAQVGQG